MPTLFPLFHYKRKEFEIQIFLCYKIFRTYVPCTWLDVTLVQHQTKQFFNSFSCLSTFPNFAWNYLRLQNISLFLSWIQSNGNFFETLTPKFRLNLWRHHTHKREEKNYHQIVCSATHLSIREKIRANYSETSNIVKIT